MSHAIIEVENLVFEYPSTRALSGVSFTIQAGSVTALVGPNGAGKTTLMRCLAALETPFSGTIRIAGVDTKKDPRRCHEKIGYLSDFFGLYEDLTVRQSLSFMARINSHPLANIPELVEEIAVELDLGKQIDSKASMLSRGMRQRLAIGKTIINRPEVILLDEPASGLDPEARGSLSSLILSLREGGSTVMVSSHILSELEDYSDSMLICRNGQILGHESLEKEANDDRCTVRVKASDCITEISELLLKQESVIEVKEAKEGLFCQFSGGEGEQKRLLRLLVENDLPISDFSTIQTRLQDVYLKQIKEGME